MHSVYRQTAPPRFPVPDVDPRPGGSGELLAAVARVARGWLTQIDSHDPHREQIRRISIMADDLAAHGTSSPSAIAAIRTVLCANCHRLDAAPWDCSGQGLDRCPLLTGASQSRTSLGTAPADPAATLTTNSRETRGKE